MKLPRFIPHPASWASAVALFVFALGVSFAFGFIFPLLAELMRHSPRLAWLGMLLTWLAPIGAAAAIHRIAGGVVDFSDKKKVARPSSSSESLWAGFVAWAAILFVTMTTSFVMLVLDPPPVDPDAMWNVAAVMTRGVSGLVQSAIWIVLAAYVYELERAARSRAPDA